MTAQRIERTFQALSAEGRTALVAYVTCGYPTIEDSYQASLAALEAGADLLELGVPFSDPTADGPVIAQAMFHAIEAGGSLRAALEVAARLREKSEKPIVLFTYYNPIVAFGDAALPSAARKAGIDGLLVVDLPPEEGPELRASALAEELAIVPLVAPTTGQEREERILPGSRGFVYYVSVTGVTGSGTAPLADAGRQAKALQERSGLPVAVGFGIDGPEKARIVRDQGASGVVVGTAIVRAMGSSDNTASRVAAVKALVTDLREGLDSKP